jgi:uncharacterized membrane protein
MPAPQTFPFVHAEPLSAVGTGPLFIFVFQKRFHAVLPDIRQVFDRAGAVLGSITFIQMPDPFTGINGAAVAALQIGLFELFAVLDFTG